MNISAANLSSALYGIHSMGSLGRTSRSSSYQNPLYTPGSIIGVSPTAAYGKTYAISKIGTEFRKAAQTLQETDFSKTYRFTGKKQIWNQVRTFAESYNSLLSNVSNATEKQKLKQPITDNRTVLAKVGLNLSDDGSLAVDNKALKKAKIADLTAVFSGAESPAGKMAVKSIYAEASAVAGSSVYPYGLNAYGLGNYGLGTYGLGAYGLGSYGLSSYGLGAYALGNYGMGSLYNLGRYFDMSL